jgi:L-asparaginase
MVADEKTGTLVPARTLEELVQCEPELEELADIQVEILFNLDSSDVTPKHWEAIAEKVITSYKDFDAFVVTFGTDTMAYAASGVSFLLENLGKPVIFTGSQYPLSGGMRTDAKINLYNALLFASKADIGEVAISFGSQLLRGNRSTKIDAEKLDAFSSPNMYPLGQISSYISLSSSRMKKKKTIPSLRGKLSPHVTIVKVWPGISPEMIHSIPNSIKGIIIEGFGSGGNIPQSILKALKKKIDSGVIIALTSQCFIGNINLSVYEGGNYAKKMGVLECKDMTTEAAFCKLSWLLGKKELSSEEIKNIFEMNIRGEISEEEDQEE